MKTENIEDLENRSQAQNPTPQELWRLYHRSQDNAIVEEELVKSYLYLVKALLGGLQ
jgi:hypothetical protein